MQLEPYAPKRPSIGKKRRAAIFLAHGGICHLCKLKIGPTEPYDIDHIISRELGGEDDEGNLAPAHKACHKAKSREDVRLIAKGNRIRKRNLPKALRPKPKHPIQSRGFDKTIRRRMSGKIEKRLDSGDDTS